MLGVVAVPVGLLVGLALIYWFAPKSDLAMPKQTDAAEGSPDATAAAAPGKSSEELMNELRNTGRTTRTFLDVCFLLFIVAAVLSILVYELKKDPMTELARIFPREVSVIANFFRGIRESWPANMLKR